MAAVFLCRKGCLLVRKCAVRDHSHMEQPQPSPQLEAFFELCKRMYERMEREGTWPWTADSTNPEDMVDSESNQNVV